jgi:hypothetical protein
MARGLGVLLLVLSLVVAGPPARAQEKTATPEADPKWAAGPPCR